MTARATAFTFMMPPSEISFNDVSDFAGRHHIGLPVHRQGWRVFEMLFHDMYCRYRTPNGSSRERTMRFAALASLAGALVVMTVSAQATWRGYISHPLGF